MKFRLLKILLLAIAFSLNFFAYAGSLSSGEKAITEKLAQRIQSERGNYEYNTKLAKYESLINTIKILEPKIDEDKQALASYLRILLEEQYNEVVVNGNQETTTDGPLVYEVPNVDMAKVIEAWLSWHNQARANVGRDNYTRNSELERTAHDWALYLAQINASTHKRSSSDPYYSYESIKNWFANKGVYFDESQGTAFTENIAYQYYSCNKDDCTQDLINALKKGFDFFMSEASYNGPHYRGVVSSTFTEMGMGVAFVGSRYFVVTHYAVGVLD